MLLGSGTVSAILAAACCWRPVLLAVVGASGAWTVFASALEPYRPIFIVATLAALLLARPRPSDDDPASDARRQPLRSWSPGRYEAAYALVLAFDVVALCFPLIARWIG